MSIIIERLNKIKSNIHDSKTNIIAVSKTFQIDIIKPLIDSGHKHYGENKVQEADFKWSDIKKTNKNIQLHMIGRLQTNKAKRAVELFDYIHSLDTLKLADKIANEQVKINKKVKIFIQVNIGNESQKNGIHISELENFYNKCTKELELNIVGLMCLPPIDQESSIYFSKMKKLSTELNLAELSMGMSADFLNAAENGSTYLRIGSKIFGNRN